MTTAAITTKHADQLVLLPTEGSWRIDDDTRRIGRAGIARARAALAATANRTPDTPILVGAGGGGDTLQLAA